MAASSYLFSLRSSNRLASLFTVFFAMAESLLGLPLELQLAIAGHLCPADRLELCACPLALPLGPLAC